MNNQKAKQLRREAEQYPAASEASYYVTTPCGSIRVPFIDGLGNTQYKDFPKDIHGGTLVMDSCIRAVYKGLKQDYKQ